MELGALSQATSVTSPGSPTAQGGCCRGQSSLEDAAGETLASRDRESSNPAGEGRAKSRAAACSPQLSVSWVRESKVTNFGCLRFAAPRSVLPKVFSVLEQVPGRGQRDTETRAVPG